MILPVICPRIQTGCCAPEWGKGELPETHYKKCEKMEEYIYCEYFSSGMMGRQYNFHVMQIVHSARRR